LKELKVIYRKFYEGLAPDKIQHDPKAKLEAEEKKQSIY